MFRFVGICLASIATFVGTMPARAQTPDARFTTLCARLSEGNMRDTTNSISDEYKFSLFRRAILSRDFETYSEFESTALNLGISVETLQKTFGFDASTKDDSQKFKQRMQTFKDEIFTLDQASANSRLEKSIISSLATEMIKSCISYARDVALNQQGLFIQSEPVDRELKLWLVRLSRRTGGQAATNTVTGLYPSLVKCSYKGQVVIIGTTNITEADALLECEKPNGREPKTLSISLSSTGAAQGSTTLIGTDDVAEARIDAVKAEAAVRERQLLAQLAEVKVLSQKIQQNEADLHTLNTKHDTLSKEVVRDVSFSFSDTVVEISCPHPGIVHWVWHPGGPNNTRVRCASLVIRRAQETK